MDPAERRVATGSADNELRLYSVAEPDAEGAPAKAHYAAELVDIVIGSTVASTGPRASMPAMRGCDIILLAERAYDRQQSHGVVCLFAARQANDNS